MYSVADKANNTGTANNNRRHAFYCLFNIFSITVVGSTIKGISEMESKLDSSRTPPHTLIALKLLSHAVKKNTVCTVNLLNGRGEGQSVPSEAKYQRSGGRRSTFYSSVKH